MQQCFSSTPDDVLVTWLPRYPDMGLIGGILQPVFVGAHAVMLDPISFLKHPLVGPKAISAFGATCSTAPNFGKDDKGWQQPKG